MFRNLIFNLRSLTSNEEFGNPICFRTSFNSVCMGAKVDVTRRAQYGSFTLDESGSKSEKKIKEKTTNIKGTFRFHSAWMDLKTTAGVNE